MKYINLAYVNLAFVVVGVAVIAYTFSVTFLSSAEVQDQFMDIQIPSSPQERSLEIPPGVSPESSVVGRSPGSSPGPARTPAEVRKPSSRTSTSPASTRRTPASRAPSNVQRADRPSRLPNVNAGRPTAGRATSRTSPSGRDAPTTRQPQPPGSGFVVTPSQRSEQEKRSAPARAPNRPPVRGSLDR